MFLGECVSGCLICLPSGRSWEDSGDCLSVLKSMTNPLQKWSVKTGLIYYSLWSLLREHFNVYLHKYTSRARCGLDMSVISATWEL
jgi:hypothetical protein